VLDKSPEEQKLLASCGRPCPGVHMGIVDGDNQDVRLGEAGEIVIKSRSIMSEYWEKPEETKSTLKEGKILKRKIRETYRNETDRKRVLSTAKGFD
jgi:long-subunit acyl-CoA synthetase (AMP-forming)